MIGRMAEEIFLFRSLFRNTDVKIIDGRPVYGSAKWLWFFGLMFHLIAFDCRDPASALFYRTDRTPGRVDFPSLDGFSGNRRSGALLSDLALLAGLTFLFLRRVVIPQVRYISLFTDYFALLLIAGVVSTGLLMRHFFPVDLNALKTLAMGWVTFSPVVPKGRQRCFLHPPLFRLYSDGLVSIQQTDACWAASF